MVYDSRAKSICWVEWCTIRIIAYSGGTVQSRRTNSGINCTRILGFNSPCEWRADLFMGCSAIGVNLFIVLGVMFSE